MRMKKFVVLLDDVFAVTACSVGFAVKEKGGEWPALIEIGSALDTDLSLYTKGKIPSRARERFLEDILDPEKTHSGSLKNASRIYFYLIFIILA